jgi:hypothetical protein
MAEVVADLLQSEAGIHELCGATIKVRDSDNQDENAPGVV